MAAFGRVPIWLHEPYNLAEAVGDEAEMVRLIEQGHDPNMRYDIRMQRVFDYPTRLTPLEAAVVRDDASVLRQLLAKGHNDGCAPLGPPALCNDRFESPCGAR